VNQKKNLTSFSHSVTSMGKLPLLFLRGYEERHFLPSLIRQAMYGGIALFAFSFHEAFDDLSPFSLLRKREVGEKKFENTAPPPGRFVSKEEFLSLLAPSDQSLFLLAFSSPHGSPSFPLLCYRALESTLNYLFLFKYPTSVFPRPIGTLKIRRLPLSLFF